MKGIIFTEFLEFVEGLWGMEFVDGLISDAQDPNNGAYTAVNNYDHTLLVNLVVTLEKKTQIPLPDLLQKYGRHLFGQLADRYAVLLEGQNDPLELLMSIEEVIHTEVRKLYPEAKPPMFSGKRISESEIELRYESHRGMGDVAFGLIQGCGDHFDQELHVEKIGASEDGKIVDFRIKK
jgi:hypothetical protein